MHKKQLVKPPHVLSFFFALGPLNHLSILL